MIFIAEVGLNHNGNLDLAGELIKQAKLAGADIVKFQLGWRGLEGELNYIDEDKLKTLRDWADFYSIELMFSIFNKDAFALSKKIELKRYKIASRTVIDDPALVSQILQEGKETFLSLGMWKEKELPFKEFKNVRYLWCKSEYPTLPWNLNDFPKSFIGSSFAGYSDHTIGIEVALMAISRGAEVIERHLTLDKSDSTIRDHVLSSTPDEFKLMVNLGRNLNKNLLLGV